MGGPELVAQWHTVSLKLLRQLGHLVDPRQEGLGFTKHFLHRKEVLTQVDLIVMIAYSLGFIPLIRKL